MPKYKVSIYVDCEDIDLEAENKKKAKELAIEYIEDDFPGHFLYHVANVERIVNADIDIDFLEYLEKSLKKSEEEIIKAWNIAKESHNGKYKDQKITLEVITKDILTGNFQEEED